SDIPPSLPTAVLMIHSFSAANPNDPGTIAGRWLANGAFVYFGSMFEPYLQSFRPPRLVASLAEEGVPLGAATRRLASEPFGHPWRLASLGDPLFSVRRPAGHAPRLGQWADLADWPPYPTSLPQRPDSRASDAERLNWVVTAAIGQLQRGGWPDASIDVLAV